MKKFRFLSAIALLLTLCMVFAACNTSEGGNNADGPSYRVMVSASKGATVLPGASQTVPEGGTAVFNIQFEENYVFLGSDVGVFDPTTNTLTVENVTKATLVTLKAGVVDYDTNTLINYRFYNTCADDITSIPSNTDVALGTEITVKAGNLSRYFAGWSIGESTEILSKDRTFTFRITPEMVQNNSLLIKPNYITLDTYSYDANGGKINNTTVNAKSNTYAMKKITGNKITVTLREMVFDKIQRLSIARISKRTSGELMNRVSNDTAELSRFISNEFGNMFEQVLILLVVGIYLFSYDWLLALMIILPTPIVLYSYRLFHRFMHQIFHRQWQLNSRANTILHDTFSGIRVVKAFGMERREINRYDTITRDERDAQIKAEKFFGRIQPVLSFVMGIGEYFLLFYVGNKIIGGEMTIGQMSQFSAYVSIIYGPLRWLSSIPRRLTRVMTSIVKIFDIIDEDVDVADRENAIDHTIDGTITFENVSFGYDKTQYVLKNICAEIKPGEMVGIVGKSGVGKSTLINLVMRMYDVTEGSIKIDGIDIKDISQQSLRSQIGVVLQETFLFSGTIYDNIAYAKPDATRDEVITAAKIAGAHSFIMKLPNAYNTKVGERGHTLSGGERQRVAIARALLHNPKILILDEATASLDTETEKQIQDALQKLIADRTTLAIAHRLSTLRNATKIIVLDKGGVAEVGSHDELIRKQGIYYGLVMAQRQMSKMSPKNQA